MDLPDRLLFNTLSSQYRKKQIKDGEKRHILIQDIKLLKKQIALPKIGAKTKQNNIDRKEFHHITFL